MAEKEKSGDPDRRLAREARVALSQAEGLPRGGSPKAAADEARRAAALASEALREVARRREAEEAARLEAEKRAREAASKVAAVDEADRRRQAEAALAEIEELRQKTALDLERTRLSAAALAASGAQLEEERGRLVEEREALRRERDALAAGLADALEKVAPTLETARGLVATLPGTSFDPGKAALRAAARVTIGKLAGILLMVPEHNVRIEGYTDSAGNAAANRKLSAGSRAKRRGPPPGAGDPGREDRLRGLRRREPRRPEHDGRRTRPEPEGRDHRREGDDRGGAEGSRSAGEVDRRVSPASGAARPLSVLSPRAGASRPSGGGGRGSGDGGASGDRRSA